MSTPPTPPEEKTTLTIGQLLGHSNQFRIVRLLGRGGFGEVYLAHEDRAQRHLAIKVMLPKLNRDKKMLRRFKGEYTLGSALSHPSLVQMYDLAETPDGVHYIVMEYIDGEVLAVRMHRAEQTDGQLGPDAALSLGWQISSLFAQLHERRIIHRDLKPGNIMVLKDPLLVGGERYRLLDFGIAKLVDPEKAKSLNVDFQTSTGVHLGTIPLMSPESFKPGSSQGPETDVYSLGCMLYRCIAGNYPFAGSTDMELIVQHMHDDPIPLTAEDPTLAHDVADIIHSMLAKDPAARPTMAQASEFFAAKLGLASMAAGQIVVKGGTQQLQSVLGDVSTGAVSVTADGSGAGVPAVNTSAPTAGSSMERQSVQGGQQVTAPHTKAARRRQFVLGAGFGGVALLILSAILVRRAADSHQQPATTTLVAPPLPAASPPVSPPDLGGTAALPPSKSEALSTVPDENASATEKKRRKKKNGRLLQD